MLDDVTYKEHFLFADLWKRKIIFAACLYIILQSEKQMPPQNLVNMI